MPQDSTANPEPDLERTVMEMAPFKETIAFHAHGGSSEKFEESLAQAVELCSDDGYEVVGISHAAGVSYGDAYDAVLYSAVVWGQRAATSDAR